MPGDDTNSRTPKLRRCSFCGKTERQVMRMVAGANNVCICNECIELCQEVLNGDSQRASEPRAKRETVSDTIPMPKPQDIKRVLDEYVIGQDRAKRALCVAIPSAKRRPRVRLPEPKSLRPRRDCACCWSMTIPCNSK